MVPIASHPHVETFQVVEGSFAGPALLVVYYSDYRNSRKQHNSLIISAIIRIESADQGVVGSNPVERATNKGLSEGLGYISSDQY